MQSEELVSQSKCRKAIEMGRSPDTQLMVYSYFPRDAAKRVKKQQFFHSYLITQTENRPAEKATPRSERAIIISKALAKTGTPYSIAPVSRQHGFEISFGYGVVHKSTTAVRKKNVNATLTMRTGNNSLDRRMRLKSNFIHF